MNNQIPVTEMTLRDMLAAGATEKDVNVILNENIQAFQAGTKIHDRQSARWEHADRMLAIRAAAMPNDPKVSHDDGDQL